MPTTHTDRVLRQIHTLAQTRSLLDLPDEQLLRQFTTGREDAAFAELVRRHGPLVLSVCRRVLHREQDVEDAFQATFLILARKATTIDRQASVACWLHRVAYHAAVRVRANLARAGRDEQGGRRPDECAADPLSELSGRELLAVIDEELQRL